MGKTIDYEALAKKYDLPADFVESFYSNVVDKDNFERGLKMFVDGTLKYEVAIGKEPIVIADIRHEVADNLQGMRNRAKVMTKKQKELFEYYSGCTLFQLKDKKKLGVLDVVFIKDGHLVAFGHYERKNGGIYAANNEVMPDFNWQPHEYLGVLRQKNKAFYRTIKKAAVNSPAEWFDFNIK